MLYASDSAFFELQNRMFTRDVIDARKDYCLFPGDSVRYLASFYFKPGLGVVKYIMEKAPMGTRQIKLQQVSTLVAFHIE